MGMGVFHLPALLAFLESVNNDISLSCATSCRLCKMQSKLAAFVRIQDCISPNFDMYINVNPGTLSFFIIHFQNVTTRAVHVAIVKRSLTISSPLNGHI